MKDKLPVLLFFMGLAGAGKTFAGKFVAKEFGYFSYDLDADFTPAMLEAITDKKSFTDEMRDQYFKVVSDRISRLRREHSRLLVMQAAYKERHRAMLLSAHPDLKFVWVTAPKDVMDKRLNARGDQITPEYASLISWNFEPPNNAKILLNDECSEEQLRHRFLELFQ